MIQRGGKCTKQYGMIICLTALVLFFCIAGSYAAYTNFSSAKRVVSAQSESQMLFLSDMLYIESKNTESNAYQRKRVVLGEDNGFTFEIYNYNPGNEAIYSKQDITYTLNAKVISGVGSLESYKILYDNQEYSFAAVSKLQLTLNGNQLSAHSFRLIVPEEDKDQMMISVEAVPLDECYDITNQKKLAAIIMTGELITQRTWSGHFLDGQEGHVPDDYDGFNYEISGNGEGTITLEWDSDVLMISPWFVSQIGSKNVSDGSIRFPVGGENQPSAYQTQFDKSGKWDPRIGWADLAELVHVTFSEQDSSSASLDNNY